MTDMHHEWLGGPLPQRYVIRNIGVGIDRPEGNLHFGFLNSDFAAPLEGRPIEQVVDELARQQVTEPLTWMRTDRPETPLDLGIEGGRPPIFVILRIAGPPNMSFKPDRKAISHKSDATPAVTERYGRLRHVLASGQHGNQADENCKIVYFACRPSPIRNYSDSFNLWVRLTHPPRPGGTKRILDIIIDPDIRFPGGSATEPESEP